MAKTMISHRIDEKLVEALEKAARRERRTRSSMIELLLSQALKVNSKTVKK